jgi:hypothetical protein
MATYQDIATSYHENLEQAMEPHKGEELEKKTIIKILLAKFPALEEKSDWIYPSDHCINHTNKAACDCSMSNKAIFKRIGRGKYIVL